MSPAAARQRIVDTAYQLFARRGIRDVGVNELISSAGVAKATFYRHFASKDELVLAFLEHFGIADDDPRVNPYGGAIAMGHPLASSGVRLMNQLARQFEERPEVRYGLTTMCIGIGMGGTVIWENPNWKGAAA